MQWRERINQAILCVTVAGTTTLVPPILWLVTRKHFPEHSGACTLLFDIWLATFIVIWLILFAWLSIRKTKPPACAIGALLVAMYYALAIKESTESAAWDYWNFHHAAQALISRGNPYVVWAYGGYAPLIAQVLALCFGALEKATSLLHLSLPSAVTWGALFYAFQCAQLMVIICGFWLTIKLCRLSGMAAQAATLLATILWLFNGPAYESAFAGQCNFWVLDLMLVALIVSARLPLVSGFALALAVWIKPYPVALLPGLALTKRLKPIFSFVAGAVMIFLLQSLYGGFEIWQNFLSAIGALHFGDVSIDTMSLKQSSLYNISYVVCSRTMGTGAASMQVAKLLPELLTLLLVVWVAWRIYQRDCSFKRQLNSEQSSLDFYRLLGHTSDLLALLLLISIHVWQHHVVLALPALVWSLTRSTQPLVYASAICLLVYIPYLSLEPISFFIKPLGLLLMMLATDPRVLRPVITGDLPLLQIHPVQAKGLGDLPSPADPEGSGTA